MSAPIYELIDSDSDSEVEVSKVVKPTTTSSSLQPRRSSSNSNKRSAAAVTDTTSSSSSSSSSSAASSSTAPAKRARVDEPNKCIARIKREYENLKKEQLQGIEAKPINEEKTWLEWQATIEGPAGTPYAGGQFTMTITFTGQWNVPQYSLR